jgi:hypothetical protein
MVAANLIVVKVTAFYFNELKWRIDRKRAQQNLKARSMISVFGHLFAV